MNSHVFFFLVIFFGTTFTSWSQNPICRTNCGTLEIKYPFGTGTGCGSPRFHPFVTCSADGNHLLLTTHTGSYPITTINYLSSTLTISPPYMSNCTTMQSSQNLGLDWASPFQLGPSTFILLSCTTPNSLLTMKNKHICDPSSIYLCALIYRCPAVVDLGLPLAPPTNSCCVYSPANLDSGDELNLLELKCAGYTSVVSLGDIPPDPVQWEYGVVLKYTLGGLDSYNIAPSCPSCELSGGVCGYTPPRNSFVCVCGNGVNTSTDCNSFTLGQWLPVSSTFQVNWKLWLGILATLISYQMA